MVSDEQTVVDRVRSGEMSAFRELVEQYKHKVYYLALDLTGNHHDAEDMSQEVFMKVYTSIQNFRGDSKFSSWLYRITVNTCLDKAKKRKLQLVELNEQKGEWVGTHIGNPEKSMHRKRIQQHIDEALQQLPPQQKTIFVMRHYEDLMLREIAEILGITEGTVKAQLFRALRKLQKSLSVYRKKKGSDQ